MHKTNIRHQIVLTHQQERLWLVGRCLGWLGLRFSSTWSMPASLNAQQGSWRLSWAERRRLQRGSVTKCFLFRHGRKAPEPSRLLHSEPVRLSRRHPCLTPHFSMPATQLVHATPSHWSLPSRTAGGEPPSNHQAWLGTAGLQACVAFPCPL